ncbi:MAG TPA: GTP-binding protein [Gammaproteobacteria bacterium]|nr:GTP-binding protein [Gammaproteobacteria bacterium]HCO61541.1 GTP-binding protein [Porticoccaceae bacterium]
MSVEKHDLVHELPEYREKIHDLKMNNAHFARLFEQYHEVDHAVHRIESGAEAAADDYLEGLKKERLALKDQLYALLNKA